MVDVLMSSESVTVLGGPSSVTVGVDFGPQGQRGSTVFSGSGIPDDFFTEEVIAALDPKLYDLYINTEEGDDFGKVYQYLYVAETYSWEELAQLTGPAGPTGPTGAAGPAGADGTDGTNGTNGEGVLDGGATGQVLAKASNDDYDTQWVTVPSIGIILALGS